MNVLSQRAHSTATHVTGGGINAKRKRQTESHNNRYFITNTSEMAQQKHDSPVAFASAFLSQPNERVKRQISIIISSALVLFLVSTFVLVAMLPSPNEQRFPAIVIRSPVTNIFVRSDDKSSSSQQLLPHQKESIGGKSYASKPLSRSIIEEDHYGAAQRKDTMRLAKESIAAQTNIQEDRSSGEGNSQNKIGDDEEISSDKSEAVAETTDPASGEGNNQNEIDKLPIQFHRSCCVQFLPPTKECNSTL